MYTWYSYDISRGYETWNTAAEAEADAGSCFEQFRKKSSNGWCGIAMIEWGFLIAHGEAQPNHDGTYTMVDVSEESPLERTRRQLEQAERERDDAREQVAMLRAALQERGCCPIANGNNCADCKALAATDSSAEQEATE